MLLTCTILLMTPKGHFIYLLTELSLRLELRIVVVVVFEVIGCLSRGNDNFNPMINEFRVDGHNRDIFSLQRRTRSSRWLKAIPKEVSSPSKMLPPIWRSRYYLLRQFLKTRAINFLAGTLSSSISAFSLAYKTSRRENLRHVLLTWIHGTAVDSTSFYFPSSFSPFPG